MLKFADNSKIKEGEQMHSKQQSETAPQTKYFGLMIIVRHYFSRLKVCQRVRLEGFSFREILKELPFFQNSQHLPLFSVGWRANTALS